MAEDDRPIRGNEDDIRIVTAEELTDGIAGAPRPPMIDLGAPSGEVQLPHWTAPATGQVPQVVLGAGVDPDATAPPESVRWRDERDSADLDLMRDLEDLDPEEPVVERLGALDTSERTTDSAYLNFDDVELDPRRRDRGRIRRPRAARPTPQPAPAPAPAPDATASAPGGRNVPVAAAVGAAMALVALLAFSVGPAAALVVVEIVIAAAGIEFLTALQRNGFRPATLLGAVAIAVLPVAAYWKGEAAFPLVIVLTVLFGVAWYMFGLGGRARPVANLGVTALSVVWIGVFGAFAGLLLGVPAQGVSLLLLAIVGTVGHDVGAFFIGRAAGRTPLSTLSPNKTVEGLVGGMVGAILAVFVVAVLLGVGPFSAGGALLLGLVIAIIAALGDLAESLFKRDLGIKDMGTLLPQHGGILDRFDGMLFVLPATYYVARLCGVIG
jgi:phosphatidate cytidylyltransferase